MKTRGAGNGDTGLVRLVHRLYLPLALTGWIVPPALVVPQGLDRGEHGGLLGRVLDLAPGTGQKFAADDLFLLRVVGLLDLGDLGREPRLVDLGAACGGVLLRIAPA